MEARCSARHFNEHECYSTWKARTLSTGTRNGEAHDLSGHSWPGTVKHRGMANVVVNYQKPLKALHSQDLEALIQCIQIPRPSQKTLLELCREGGVLIKSSFNKACFNPCLST